MNAARNVFPNKAAATRAGTWFAAIAGQEWAKRKNDLPIVKALAEGVGTSGGFLVPQEMSKAIIELRDVRGVFRRVCDGATPMTSDSLSVPRRVGGATAFFSAEASTLTESNQTWDNVGLVAKKLAVLTRTSSELQEDAAANFGETISREFAYALASKEDDVGFNGTGAQSDGGIRGLTQLIIDGSHTASRVNAATGHDLFTEIDATDLALLVGTTPSYALPGASWIVSPMGFAQVFGRLAGNNGGIVVLNGEMTFWTFPIRISSVLPNVTSTLLNKVMILFGDASLSSTLGETRQITIAQAAGRYLDQDQILWKGTERIDIVNHDLGDNTTAGPIVGLVGA
jgi:HK97 family phage major capsid protein